MFIRVLRISCDGNFNISLIHQDFFLHVFASLSLAHDSQFNFVTALTFRSDDSTFQFIFSMKQKLNFKESVQFSQLVKISRVRSSPKSSRRNKKTRVITATLFEWLNECNYKKLFFNVKKISWEKRSNNNAKNEAKERDSTKSELEGTSWGRLYERFKFGSAFKFAWVC